MNLFQVSACEVCKEALEEYESERLDCGHYACNRCAYDTRGVTSCLNCHEKKQSSQSKGECNERK